MSASQQPADHFEILALHVFRHYLDCFAAEADVKKTSDWVCSSWLRGAKIVTSVAHSITHKVRGLSEFYIWTNAHESF